MVDPLTASAGLATIAGSTPSWLPWATAAGTAAGGAGSLLAASGGSKASAPTNVNIPQPQTLPPSITPGPRPGQKSMQQSFITNTAGAMNPTQATPSGKTLLGA